MRITFIRGDITEQAVDAVVNAANHSLLGGGGVDGAIHRKGGPEILADCKRIRAERYPDGLPTGESVATTAGDLPARWVIHTVGPTWARTHDKSPLLRSCYATSLAVADELSAATIAFPLVSAGIYHWPKDDAVRQALTVLTSVPTKASEASMVLFDEATLAVAQRIGQEFGLS